MGYTHYWMTTNGIDRNPWDRIRAVAQRVLEQPDLPELRGAYLWSSTPEITGELIRFNGTGDDAGYEFCLRRQSLGYANFSRCRTDRKPYDTAVTAILIAAQNIAPEHIQVKSDGQAEDWFAGLDLLNRAVPEGSPVDGRWSIPPSVVDTNNEEVTDERV